MLTASDIIIILIVVIAVTIGTIILSFCTRRPKRKRKSEFKQVDGKTVFIDRYGRRWTQKRLNSLVKKNTLLENIIIGFIIFAGILFILRILGLVGGC